MPEQRTKPCPRCDTAVPVEPIQVMGRTVWPTVLCGECAEADRQAEEAMKEEQSAEPLILRQLDMLGINVPARGRYPLAYVLDRVPVDSEPVHRFVDEAAESGRWGRVKGLILEGPTGVGKSWLMAAVLRELLERKALRPSEIIYDSSRKLWGMIKAGYGDGSADSELDRRMRCRLWALDDLGAEHPNDDTGFNFTEILSARELRPTIITANIPRDSEVQSERYDPMVWDRIKSRLGDRNFEVVRMVGPDWRAVA